VLFARQKRAICIGRRISDVGSWELQTSPVAILFRFRVEVPFLASACHGSALSDRHSALFSPQAPQLPPASSLSLPTPAGEPPSAKVHACRFVTQRCQFVRRMSSWCTHSRGAAAQCSCNSFSNK